MEKFPEIRCFFLTSKEGLFKDQKPYGNILKYTFNESGSYSFSVKGSKNGDDHHCKIRSQRIAISNGL